MQSRQQVFETVKVFCFESKSNLCECKSFVFMFSLRKVWSRVLQGMFSSRKVLSLVLQGPNFIKLITQKIRLKMTALQLTSGDSDSSLSWLQTAYLWMFSTGLLLNLWVVVRILCCCHRWRHPLPPEVVTRADAGVEWAKRQRALDPAYPTSCSRETPMRGGLASLIRRRY